MTNLFEGLIDLFVVFLQMAKQGHSKFGTLVYDRLFYVSHLEWLFIDSAVEHHMNF